MLHQFAVRPCFPCVNCFSDENNTLSPNSPSSSQHSESVGLGAGRGGGNKSAPEDKTTPNEPLIALLALLLLHYGVDYWRASLVYYDMTSLLAQTRIITVHITLRRNRVIEFIQFGLRNINLGL